MQKSRNSQITTIVCVALLVALNIIFTRFLSITTPILRIGFGFIPVAIASIAFGPFWGAVCGAVGDVLGMALWPSGEFTLGFTITAALSGIVFGLLLHGRYSLKRVILASVIVCVLLNLCLDTFWLSILMDKAYFVMLPVRIVKCVLNIPIYTVIIHILWSKALCHVQVLNASR